MSAAMSEDRGPRPRPAAVRWLPAGAAALAVLLGAIGLARPSYWFDEAATVGMAPRPLFEQLRVAEQIDAVHALFYAVMHPWVSVFGVSEAATRAPALLAFGLAAAGLSLLLLRLRTPLVALLGSLLFVLLPGIAWAGREARVYAFVLVGAVWSLVLLEALLRGRGPFAGSGGGAGRVARIGGWIGYALLIAVTMGFSVLTAPMVIGHAVLVLMVDRRAVLPAAAAWVGAVLVVSPLLLLAVRQSAQVAWIDHGIVGIAAKVLLGQLFWGPRYNDGLSPSMVAAVLLMLLCAALAVIAVVRAARAGRPDPAATDAGYARSGDGPTLSSARAVWFGLVLFAAPTVLLAGATVAGMSVYQERYALYAAPGFCLLVAEGLAALRRRRALLAAATALVVAACLPQFAAARGELSKAGENYRGLARAAAGADQVVFADPLARSISIAYPGVVSGEDLLLESSPLESGTLWGVNLDLDELDGRLAPGTVAVFAATGEAPPGLDEALAAHGCDRLEAGLVASRYSLATYSCAGRG